MAGSAGLLARMAWMAGSGGLSRGVGITRHFLCAQTSHNCTGRVRQLTETAASACTGQQVSVFRRNLEIGYQFC